MPLPHFISKWIILLMKHYIMEFMQWNVYGAPNAKHLSVFQYSLVHNDSKIKFQPMPTFHEKGKKAATKIKKSSLGKLSLLIWAWIVSKSYFYLALTAVSVSSLRSILTKVKWMRISKDTKLIKVCHCKWNMSCNRIVMS